MNMQQLPSTKMIYQHDVRINRPQEPGRLKSFHDFAKRNYGKDMWSSNSTQQPNDCEYFINAPQLFWIKSSDNSTAKTQLNCVLNY